MGSATPREENDMRLIEGALRTIVTEQGIDVRLGNPVRRIPFATLVARCGALGEQRIMRLVRKFPLSLAEAVGTLSSGYEPGRYVKGTGLVKAQIRLEPFPLSKTG